MDIPFSPTKLHLAFLLISPPPQSFAKQLSISLVGVWGGSDTPHPLPLGPPPPLSDLAKFSPGLQPIKNFLWRLRRKSV